jgi:hypothetical protein
MYVRRPGAMHSFTNGFIQSINHVEHHHWFNVQSCCRVQYAHIYYNTKLVMCVYLFPRVSSTGVMVTDGVSCLVRIDVLVILIMMKFTLSHGMMDPMIDS